MREIDCTREYGPWHGHYVCRAHYREEWWSLGRCVAWISLHCTAEERDYWSHFWANGPYLTGALRR